MNEYFENQPDSDIILEKMEGFQNWLEIDLDTIGHNIQEVKKKVGDAEIVPCVKANGYGHGIVPCVAYMETQGVKRVLVAKLWEALQLREAGLDVGIVCIDPLFSPYQFEKVVDLDITQAIYQKKPARMLSEAAEKLGKEAKAWIKVDTGLGRVGVRWSEAHELIKHVASLPRLNIDGMFSTFSEDEELDRKQVERLLEIDLKVKKMGIYPGTKSIASSNAIIHKPYSYLDAVRPGLMLYGLYPEEEDMGRGVDLKQSMTWKVRVEHVKTIEKGESLTYSRRFVAPERIKVGTLHVGYSDGYPRSLTNKGIVRVKDEMKKVLGTVSVNHFIVDLTGTNIQPGDIIESLSREGENNATNLANLAGIMTYSLANHMNMLTPRVYYINGKPVALSKPYLCEESLLT
jgi:alanine racemase